MKATQRDFASTAAKAARQCRIFFFCGPDEAGAAAAADRIAALLDNPGERVELAGSDLRKDPALLGDEARSSSLFGDARHIYVRANGDEAHDALAVLIESTEAENIEAAPVLVVAQSATDKSRTAKLLEKRADALVAMFYPPDLQSVVQEVRTMAAAAGLRDVANSLAERIARSAGLDVRLAQSEVTKLALYLDASPQAPKQLDEQALDAIGTAAEDDAFAPLVNAVLSGETGRLSGELRRMRDLGMNPVGLLMAVERRAAQLAALAARMGPGGNVARAVEAEVKARRIFWRDQKDIARQLACWRGKRLERLVDRLVEAHQALMVNNQSAEMRLAQELAEITRFAAAGSRAR